MSELKTLTVDVRDDESPEYAVFETIERLGWGDGLPVIVPTAERVQRMVAAGGRPADEVLAVLPPAETPATIEMIAVNAVMAGCAPEYFPVVLAAMDAMVQPRFSLLGLNTTTNPGAPMLIVNGPIRDELGINYSWGALGPYFRANSTIGRAISLCMIDIAGRIPGGASRGTFKQPGAFSMCVGEDEARSPWEPMHVGRGLSAEDNAVTVLAVAGTADLIDPYSRDGEVLALSLAHMMGAQVGSNWLRPELGEIGLMLCPAHATLLAERFPTHEEFQAFLQQNCKVPHQLVSEERRDLMKARGFYFADDEGLFVTTRPDQWLVFVAGGLGGLHSCHLSTFGAAFAVTHRIGVGPTA